MSNGHIENPKHSQADGAGFGRLRAEQAKRTEFTRLCQQSHPSCVIHVDQVREYAGVQIAFYRVVSTGQFAYEHARVAVFQKIGGKWSKESDIIAAQA